MDKKPGLARVKVYSLTAIILVWAAIFYSRTYLEIPAAYDLVLYLAASFMTTLYLLVVVKRA